MPDYSNGKIYKIYCNITGETYYGSTCQPVSVRMGQHRSDAKENSKKTCTSKSIIVRDDYDYSLIENHKCNNKQELHARERYWIENNECINKIVPNRTLEEYYLDNKEYIKDQHKKWRENGGNMVEKKRKVIYREENKEKIAKTTKAYYLKNKVASDAYQKEWASKKVVCECGCEMTQKTLPKHRKTKKHENLLQSLGSGGNII